MLQHHIKLAIRSLLRNKLNSVINIFGLGTGMAAVIIIFLFVQHELSYDKFNEKHRRIYRLNTLTSLNEQEKEDLPACLRLDYDNFTSKVPEIKALTQLLIGRHQKISVGDKVYENINFQYVDTNFDKIFTLTPISGLANHIFSNPSGVVMNASTAQKVFNTTNAAGKEIEIFNQIFTISAVVKDLPSTSHYDFDILLPFTTFPKRTKYRSLEYLTYILFKEEADIAEASTKTEQLYNQMLTERFGPYGEETDSYLQKLKDIHLNSTAKNYLKPYGNYQTIYLLITLAFLILVIAIINFINIMTVQYESRTREIGIKKTIGISRTELMRQFLGNSILLTFSSLLLGIILVEILLPHFSNLLGRNLEIDYSHNQTLLFGLPTMAVLVGILSGIYPAFIISKQNPSKAIKGIGYHSKGTNLLTRILVIFQFTVAIILIASVVILQLQISYMKTTDLGFNTQKVIAINNLSKKQRQSYSSIKQELLKIPSISVVSASDHLPGGKVSGQMISLVGKNEKEYKSFNEYRIMPDYFKALGIRFKEGHPLNNNKTTDKEGIILNETAAKYLGVEDAIGREVWFHDKKHEIQGIVKDFHYTSLKENIAPLMFSKSWGIGLILLKVNSPKFSKLLPRIKQVMRKFDPERENSHIIIEDICRNRYQKEEHNQQLAIYFSVLSIILALLGLYSLSLFMMHKRTKEIGIRKVNGASILQISNLLLGKFAHWIGIAFFIAAPITWWIMNRWLENFAYRIEIGPWPFVVAGSIALAFALLTVGWQTWKAASRNPVESLRSE
ncbi:MAG: ABC transporter permease [Marinifilaceae bacterium]